ncbi:MAG: copper-binding protein [Desulfovibrio sp.]|jgi:Cu(I)/Ag(I) efflux system membrane fusion protein|nr:copper-binding protein [Desulfovibrio sp.]
MFIRILFSILALTLSLVSPTFSLAAHKDQCGGHVAAHDMSHGGAHQTHAGAAAGKVYAATGKVVLADKATGALTLYHEPVPALNWPAMTMPFGVEDASLLDGLKKDDPVRFDFRIEGQKPVVVDIEKRNP